MTTLRLYKNANDKFKWRVKDYATTCKVIIYKYKVDTENLVILKYILQYNYIKNYFVIIIDKIV